MQLSAESNKALRSTMRILINDLFRYAVEESARKHIEAMVTEKTVDMRVDWNGGDSRPSFEVQVGVDEWIGCEHLTTESPNDVISPAVPDVGEPFLVRFHRGPDNEHAGFGVRAIPITWTNAPESSPPANYVAQRGRDYTYVEGVNPDSISWSYATSIGGVQQVSLELTTACDYEIWVRIQDPNEADQWIEIDPIVRSSSGGGNPH